MKGIQNLIYLIDTNFLLRITGSNDPRYAESVVQTNKTHYLKYKIVSRNNQSSTDIVNMTFSLFSAGFIRLNEFLKFCAAFLCLGLSLFSSLEI